MIQQSMKFVLVGVTNTIISYLVFIGCNLLVDNYLVSLLISYIIGVVNSYFLNKNWTFRTPKTRNLSTIIKFITVYLCTFLVNLIILILLVDFLYFSASLSQAISLIITTMISFIGHKYWSFKNKEVSDVHD
ncbi:GtrA family protein [Paenibacillus sp. GYB004]|uniref:GtrA family protein n=1 Tax=Paenibacillus sp. GYB004 TaxID=2994393 RepID=UPI003FA6BA53